MWISTFNLRSINTILKNLKNSFLEKTTGHCCVISEFLYKIFFTWDCFPRTRTLLAQFYFRGFFSDTTIVARYAICIQALNITWSTPFSACHRALKEIYFRVSFKIKRNYSNNIITYPLNWIKKLQLFKVIYILWLFLNENEFFHHTKLIMMKRIFNAWFFFSSVWS